ncbi:MAG: MBL fold metallo-hydrolase [Planctomycetota bacterium]
MKLLLLGTTGYHPNDRRQTACLMLPEIGLVFDAGTAAYRLREYLKTPSLDIFLTHAHLDHVIGLTFLFNVIDGTGIERVAVHGEPEKLEAIQQHLFSELLFPVAPPLDMHPLEQNHKLADGSVLTHFPLEHPGGSVGYRIDWPDRSFAYVTDTVAFDDAPYLKLIEGVDVLVHECYFNDDMREHAELTGHSCLSDVARVASKSGAKRTILVHMNPMYGSDNQLLMAEAKRICPTIELGVDRMEVDF